MCCILLSINLLLLRYYFYLVVPLAFANKLNTIVNFDLAFKASSYQPTLWFVENLRDLG